MVSVSVVVYMEQERVDWREVSEEAETMMLNGMKHQGRREGVGDVLRSPSQL